MPPTWHPSGTDRVRTGAILTHQVVREVRYSSVSQHPEPSPSPAGLSIDERRVAGTLVVSVAGEIDMATAPTLRAAVQAAIRESAGEACVLDLTAVTFLGSSGLSALVEAAQLSEARREPLRIVVDANRPVIRPIMVTGLDDVLALYHTVDEALAPQDTDT